MDHDYNSHHFQWSCNDRHVYTGCTDASVRVWNLKGELLHTMTGHDEDAYVLQAHPRLPQ